MDKKRGIFKSNFGAIAAATGSAIGLGNIWRFPYVLGENGGAAFLIIYLLIIIIIGIPLIMTEFSLGRLTNKNVFGTFRVLSPNKKYFLIGIIGILTSIIILSYYSVIAGWTVAFLKSSITNSFKGLTSNQISDNFSNFVNNGAETIGYMILFIAATSAIVIGGVEKGIERYNKFLMPILMGILVVLLINSFTLEGINDGLKFMFNPDFSKVTADVVLSALGQAFFSMSIGMGCMLTYGSYMRKEDNIFKTSAYVAAGDVFIAILAGFAIFPAVFTFNIEPASGPNLVFITLPNIFAKMTGGYIFGILFFLLLFVAALTSSVSLMEVSVAYFTEELKIKRNSAVAIVSLVCVTLGAICALSQIEGSTLIVAKQTIFDLFDYVSSSYMLTLSGFLIVIYVGWIKPYNLLKNEITANGKGLFKAYDLYMFIIKYIAPVAIILIFLTMTGVI